MTAESLLTTYVQVGIAISGFSGIVVALGNRGRGEWSYHDRQLLYALLRSSGGCALLSAVPLILASAGLAEPTVWAASSGCSIVLQLGFMVARARSVMRDADTLARARWVIAGAFSGGVVCATAQLVNCVWLGVAWPHLATITWHLALSFIVFVRLVQPEARP
jgi:putative intracellular protease/amidase